MKVYILTRTENFGEPRRIVEQAFSSLESAEKARQNMLKMFNAPSKLCIDAEIDTLELLD